MDSPVLVTIDLQRDFYHEDGTYAQHDRPLAPIRDTIEILKPIVRSYPSVLRIRSVYRPGQFEDMPELCRPGGDGIRWHPELAYGPLLTKRVHSGLKPLRQFFSNRPPLVLAGVCTHRCVRATFRALREDNWPVKILENGVASCGFRRPQHRQWVNRWRRNDQLVQTSELMTPSDSGNINPQSRRFLLEHERTA